MVFRHFRHAPSILFQPVVPISFSSSLLASLLWWSSQTNVITEDSELFFWQINEFVRCFRVLIVRKIQMVIKLLVCFNSRSSFLVINCMFSMNQNLIQKPSFSSEAKDWVKFDFFLCIILLIFRYFQKLLAMMWIYSRTQFADTYKVLSYHQSFNLKPICVDESFNWRVFIFFLS